MSTREDCSSFMGRVVRCECKTVQGQDKDTAFAYGWISDMGEHPHFGNHAHFIHVQRGHESRYAERINYEAIQSIRLLTDAEFAKMKDCEVDGNEFSGIHTVGSIESPFREGLSVGDVEDDEDAADLGMGG